MPAHSGHKFQHIEDADKKPRNLVSRNRKGPKEVIFDSTCLAEGEFDPEDETLTVTFTDGRGPYTYDCTKQDWKELLASDSIGVFFNLEIKT